MKKSTLYSYILFIFLLLFKQSTFGSNLNLERNKTVTDSSDPISFIAHGDMFDEHRQKIKPDAYFILNALNHYIRRLSTSANQDVLRKASNHIKNLSRQFKDDSISQKFLLMEYLTHAVKPKDKAYLHAKNLKLRRIWYRSFMGTDRYRLVMDNDSLLPSDIARYARHSKIINPQTHSTKNNYIEQCRVADVPIPPPFPSSEWSYEGDLLTNFIPTSGGAEVWRSNSTSPKGLCVAAVRKGLNEITQLGIICLGVESSNACFFDAKNLPLNDNGELLQTMTAEDLVNPFDPEMVEGGICSDCHAGENPFVVHPDEALDFRPDNMPLDWHTPIVASDWPKNPGPMTLLDNISLNPLKPDEDKSCLSCHHANNAGRFPDVLALNDFHENNISRYCKAILLPSMWTTMPPDSGNYLKHREAMTAFCEQTTPPNGKVPPPHTADDPDVLSPPIIIDPLYACASNIGVKGANIGSTISIYIDDNLVSEANVTSTNPTIVQVPPLIVDQSVYALQTLNGTVSGESNKGIVIDHNIHFPSGLPAPVIDPNVLHQCGWTLAVKNIPGADVTVFSNGSDPVTITSGTSWSNVAPAVRPFELNGRYSAQQSLCGKLSELSPEVIVGEAPNPMPIPTVKPSPPFIGQQLITINNLANGALTTVSETIAGDLVTTSTASDTLKNIDISASLNSPLQADHEINIVSTLCEPVKLVVPEPVSCSHLGPPTLATPVVGQTVIEVSNAVPGARIFIYDADDNEIGDGAGNQVGLIRAVQSGDLLKAIQKVGNCSSHSAYQTGVVCITPGACD